MSGTAGRLQTGTKSATPTLRAVASAAGVSIATASNVLSNRVLLPNGKRRYSLPTETRVRERAAEMKYVPNLAARAVRTGHTGLVQVSLSVLHDPWALAMGRAINLATRNHGLVSTIVADGDWVQMLRIQQADCALIDEVSKDQIEDLKTLASQGRKLLVVSETLEPSGFSVIRQGIVAGCTLMVDYLAENYDTIGCIAPANDTQPEQSRLRPYEQMLERTKRDKRDEWVRFYQNDVDSAYEQALAILSLEDRPRALYVTTDFAAQAAIRAADRLGLRVPEDIAISGVGNTPGAASSDPSLTTVGADGFFESVADLVVDLALGNEQEPKIYDYPWTLHLRDSA